MTPRGPGALPEVVYTPESALRRPAALFGAMWGDLLLSRELAWRLAVRDFKAQYRQSLLGYAWAILPPVLATLTFVALRKGRFFSTEETGVPYPLFVFVGTVVWQTFTDALGGPLRVLNASRAMLTKINFPREALILAGALGTLINTGIRLAVLVPVLLYYDVSASPGQLLFPLGLLGVVALGLCVGLLLAPTGLLYKDVERGLAMLLVLWMFVTPVVFPRSGSGLASTVMTYNPVTPLVEVSRAWLLGVPVTGLAPFAAVVASALGLLCLGWLIYRLALPHLIARLGM